MTDRQTPTDRQDGAGWAEMGGAGRPSLRRGDRHHTESQENGQTMGDKEVRDREERQFEKER